MQFPHKSNHSVNSGIVTVCPLPQAYIMRTFNSYYIWSVQLNSTGKSSCNQIEAVVRGCYGRVVSELSDDGENFVTIGVLL